MLFLEIFHKDAPAQQVPEYSEIELRLTNSGQTPLEGLILRLGREKLRSGLGLRLGSSFAFPYIVGDLVGELNFVAGNAQVSASVGLTVIPRHMSLDEVGWIKTERLPTLLARLDAPNRLPLSYDDEEHTQPFDYFSVVF